MEHIQQTVKDYIVETFMYDDSNRMLGDDDLLFREGIINSLGVFRLISFIGEHFRIEIQPDDVVLENFESVGAIKNFITGKLSTQQQGA